jgi:hypothetical protein
LIAARVATLSVDGRAIRDVEADTIPDRKDGVKLAGVAGVDLMLGRLTVIDFGCGTAALLPIPPAPAKIAGGGATLVQAGAIRDGKQLTLPVTINAVVGVAVLDSGARATPVNPRFAAAAGIDPLPPAFRDDTPTRGATMTAVPTRIGPIGNVAFAGISRPNAVARVVDLPYFASAGIDDGPAMNLGLDLLRDTRLTIDYSARRFWLAQSACAAAPTARPATE